MPSNQIQRLIFLGGLVIIGIIFTQTYILMKTWHIKDQDFDQTARIMLRRVAERISVFNNTELPKTKLIQRTSSNYYAVNIHSTIDASILEDYLIQETTNHSIKTDFEYGVYDCHTKDLVYGNYCRQKEEGTFGKKGSKVLPKLDKLDYYFVVSFPSRESYLLSNMGMAILFSLISVLAVLFFLYAIWIIVRQKRLSELQKDFINNMTHEFKTPLSSIKIASDYIAKHESIRDNPKLSKYTSIIKNQNLRLTNQVEKVLNIAKLEGDNFKLNLQPLEVNILLQSIVDSENMRIGEPRVSLEMDDASSKIMADKLHFTNVVTNLIDNAIKYSPAGTPVDISVRQRGKMLHIDIADHGIGIKKDDLDKIFNKFFRVSTGNVHNVKGFGLGLHYVRNIVDAHKWKIEVQSEINKGSIFSLLIPTTSQS